MTMKAFHLISAADLSEHRCQLCTACIDYSAELADVSIGDAWNQNLSGKDGGWAVIISRSELGRQLLLDADNDLISLKKIPISLIEKSHANVLRLKKRPKTIIKRIFYNTIPVYTPDISPNPCYIRDHLIDVLAYAHIYLGRFFFFRKILQYIPEKLLARYIVCLRLLNAGNPSKLLKKIIKKG